MTKEMAVYITQEEILGPGSNDGVWPDIIPLETHARLVKVSDDNISLNKVVKNFEGIYRIIGEGFVANDGSKPKCNFGSLV